MQGWAAGTGISAAWEVCERAVDTEVIAGASALQTLEPVKSVKTKGDVFVLA